MNGSSCLAGVRRRLVMLVVAVLPLVAAGLALVGAPAARAATTMSAGPALTTSSGAGGAAAAVRARTGHAVIQAGLARGRSPATGVCEVTFTPSETSATAFYGFETGETFSVVIANAGGLTNKLCIFVPTGTVTIDVDNSQMCSILLTSGKNVATGSCTIPTGSYLAVGAYTVTLNYSGDGLYAAAQATLPLTVQEQGTTTNLTLSSPGAVYSQEQSEKLSVQVNSLYQGTPTGTVVVSASGTALCTVTLSSAAGSCSLTSSQLAAGSYSITATYSGGDPDFAGSTSAAQSLYVGSDATYFTNFNSPGSAIYGYEEHQTFSVSVAAVSGTPTGTVAITDSAGTPLCSITLTAASAGSGSCSPTNITAEVPGNYSVIATFFADPPYVGSVASSNPWTVAKAHGYPSLTVHPASVTYGNEHSAVFDVTVAPEFTNGGTPSGTATVQDTSNDVLCTVTLAAGAGSCSMPNTPAGDTALGAGSYQLYATYNGDSNFSGGTDSSGSPQSFSISQASTTTGLKLSSATVTSGHENAERLKVQVKSKYPVALAGQVTIIAKATHHKPVIVCVVTLNSGKGSCKLKAKALRPGTYKLTATFGGSDDILTSTSPKKKVTVRK